MPETTKVQPTTTLSPAAESTVAPTSENAADQSRANIFSREATDLSFLDGVTAPTAQSGNTTSDKPAPVHPASSGEQVGPTAPVPSITFEGKIHRSIDLASILKIMQVNGIKISIDEKNKRLVL